MDCYSKRKCDNRFEAKTTYKSLAEQALKIGGAVHFYMCNIPLKALISNTDAC